jgi:hypothetical protein
MPLAVNLVGEVCDALSLSGLEADRLLPRAESPTEPEIVVRRRDAERVRNDGGCQNGFAVAVGAAGVVAVESG